VPLLQQGLFLMVNESALDFVVHGVAHSVGAA
jgi:hypothetical protein